MGIDHPSGTCTIHSVLDHMTPTTDRFVDLSRLTWCEVSGLVGITSIIDRVCRVGREVEVVAPSNPNVARYLSTMRLDAVLEDLDVVHDLPQVRSTNPDTILPLQRFVGAHGASRLAEHVFDTLQPVDEAVAAALYTGLCEAGENVEDHSGRDGGFVAAQRYSRDDRFMFAVGDSGIGMRRALGMTRRASHRDAIVHALRDGVTGSEDRKRGNGLPDIARSVSRLRGHVVIASGDATVVRRRGPPPDATRRGWAAQC